MIPTPTEEVRTIRRELAARSGNDIRRIAAETRQRERVSGHTYISLPARPPQDDVVPNQSLHRTGAA